jgi:hypothetical protein
MRLGLWEHSEAFQTCLRASGIKGWKSLSAVLKVFQSLAKKILAYLDAVFYLANIFD